MRYRALLRRRPFAFREEFETQAGRSAWITDGRYAWSVRDDPQRAAPLGANESVSLIEHAFFEGMLYLDPEHRGAATVGHPWSIPAIAHAPGEPEHQRLVDVIVIRNGAGTVWNCMFDAEDGRLHECQDGFARPRRHVRFGRWRRFGPLTLPTVIEQGHEGAAQPTSTLRIDEVQTGMGHRAELFAGRPVEPLAEPTPGGRLVAVPSHVPGSGYLVLPEVRINGSKPVVALLDTGAGMPCLDPRLARSLQLHPLSAGAMVATFGQALSVRHWVDTLDLGDRRFVQVRASSTSLPHFAEFGTDELPAMILGGEELLEGAPLLDLDHGVLHFRGRSAGTGVESKAGELEDRPSVVTIPFRRRHPGDTMLFVDVRIGEHTVEAVLDTGLPVVLRLSAKALQQLGLPSDHEHWLAQGALRHPLGGAGGKGGVDLLVRFDQVRLGDVAYERPWVLLSGLAAEGEPAVAPPFDAMVGAGALLPFARVGIDAETLQLELAPGPQVEADGIERLVVPDPGVFLGFKLAPPVPGALTEPAYLPRFHEVFEGGAAARLGIVPGDFLLMIGERICAAQPPGVLYRELWLRAGDTVSLTVRKADGRTVIVRLP